MIIKKHLKTKPACRVRFKLAEEEANSSKKANILVEFNKWDIDESSKKKKIYGAFTATIDFEKGKEPQLSYLLDNIN